MADDEHEFGGPWTEVKLDAIQAYLKFFTTALKSKPSATRPFVLWYVDAFAGSGERTTTRETGGLLDGVPMFREKVRLDGSARRALAINPPFKHYVFIEQNAGRFSALQRLSDENPGRGIEARMGDGNQVLGELFGSPPWSTQINGQGLHRAVVFLDPYNMAVRWSTLRSLAVTGAVDVWYLFPLSAVVRQLAHDLSSVDAGKRAALTEIFGTADWEDELYKHKIQGNLWDEAVVSARRSVSQRQIEMYAKARLETLFPQVSDPLPLVTPRNAQLFSLFCASANSSPAARALVTKGVSHVLKRYG